MKIMDIYHKKDFKHKVKKFFNNPNREGPLTNWNFAYLNHINVPNAQQIITAQREQALNYLNTYSYRNELAQLSQDLSSTTLDLSNFITYEELMHQTLEFCNSDLFYSIAFMKDTRFKNIEQLTATLRKNQIQLMQTLDGLERIYNYFVSAKQDNIVPFPKKVQTQLANLQGVITTLQQDLNYIRANPAAASLPGTISQRTRSGDGVRQGYLAYTNNIANELKGFLLPLETIRHFAKYSEKIGVIVDTGSWTDAAGKELPVDIIMGNITQVQFRGKVNGEEVIAPLIEILEKIKACDQSVSIQLYDYDSFIQQLRKQKAGLIQAKAGRYTPPLSNSFQPNVLQVAEGARNTRAGQALLRLINLKRNSSARIYVSHEYYDALFSYCLSKQMDGILGYENNLVLTPRGLQTLDQWVKTEFTTKYYQPRYHLSLTSHAAIPIALK